MLFLALLAGCLTDAPLPFVGDCAVYPQGVYEYGQIGIGTCLAGPNDLAFIEADDGSLRLLTTNANPYQMFTGGSVLSLNWDLVDLDLGRNLVTELEPGALDLPDFASGLATVEDLGMIGIRLSEDARTREWDDDVHLVDLSDASAPTFSTRGTGGGATVTVQSDPVDVVVDSTSGLAFVANRTSHSISVIDVRGDTLKVIQPWPEETLTSATFDDADQSGSTASLAAALVVDADLVPDERWNMAWVEGTWRLWLPDEFGTHRLTTTGNGHYQPSAIGTELDPDNGTGIVSEVVDPAFLAGGRMFFSDGGVLRAASAVDFLGDWAFETQTVLTGTDGDWDAVLSGPSPVVTAEGLLIYYDATDGLGAASAIGLGVSPDGQSAVAEPAPVLEGEWDHDAGGVSDPHVIYDAETDQWRMWYSAFDGSAWTIGHAVSDDLFSWRSEPIPVLEIDGDAAAPVVSNDAGVWHMWFSRRGDDGEWALGTATSPDGRSWSDRGSVAAFDDATALAEEPPGVALSADPEGSFSFSGEHAGPLFEPVAPGLPYLAAEWGFQLTAVAGYAMGPNDLGDISAGGVRIDSADLDAGIAWATVTSAGGRTRIAAAALTATGLPYANLGESLDADSGFDRDAVSRPVVAADPTGGYRMAYAGRKGSVTTIGVATSADGLQFNKVGQALNVGADWDAADVAPGGLIARDDGSWQLWYAGGDGDNWRIGSAISSDGERFTREEGAQGWQFGTGAPGDWDDSGVRDPWVVAGEDDDGRSGLHLWYSGFDGDQWRGGYAFRPDDTGVWERAARASDDTPRPVLIAEGGLFHPVGAERPVVVPTDNGWTGWYAGSAEGASRVGLLRGASPDRLNKGGPAPTVGDSLSFSTERGDPLADAIPLDAHMAEADIIGTGLTGLSVDEERGYLYAFSKLLPYIVVIDIRDDSDTLTGFVDLNYLDVEAVLTFTNSADAAGFRAVQPLAESDLIYAANTHPEGVWLVDMTRVVDDEYGNFIHDNLVGWMPAPRGLERDAGVRSQSNVGPGGMLLHPDGRRMFVSNFNANSITVYDLALGPYGQLVAEVHLIGENPYAMALTPDGRHLAIANYAGEVSESGLAESTVAVLDVDVESPTYLEVRTWLANR